MRGGVADYAILKNEKKVIKWEKKKRKRKMQVRGSFPFSKLLLGASRSLVWDGWQCPRDYQPK